MPSFFRCFTRLRFSRELRAFIFLRTFRTLIFYVPYVPLFLYVPYFPSHCYVSSVPSVFYVPHVPSLFYVSCAFTFLRAYILFTVLGQLPQRKIAPPQPQKLTLSQTGGNFPGGRQLSGYLYLCICQ